MEGGRVAYVLIEKPTPGEARTSKFIDFRISRENTSAGCLNQEEMSVLVKHRFINEDHTFSPVGLFPQHLAVSIVYWFCGCCDSDSTSQGAHLS